MQSPAISHTTPPQHTAHSSQNQSPLIHALNNKLGVILTRCELMSSRPGLDAKSSEDLQTICDAAEAMAEMVRSNEIDQLCPNHPDPQR